MKMLTHGLGTLLEKGIQDREEIQLVLGSQHGEIDPTLGFLKSFAQREWARPFLFQNSLHHSTTGFLSQKFQILGPAYSICTTAPGQQEILNFGLIQAMQEKRSTLFIHGESFPEELAKISNYPSESFCDIFYLPAELTRRIRLESTAPQKSVTAIRSFLDLQSFLSDYQSGDVGVVGTQLSFSLGD